MRSPLAPLREAATYRSLAFLSTALVVGPVVFGVLLACWITTAVLFITPLVVPLLLFHRAVSGALAQGESWLLAELLGEPVNGGRYSSGGRGYWSRGMAVIRDASFWREQAYLALRVALGWPLAIGLLSLIGASVWVIALPVTYHWASTSHVDTFQRALLLCPLGIIGLVLALNLARPLAAIWRRLARLLLSERRAASREEEQLERQRVLRVVVGLFAINSCVLLVVWAATGAGSFWPIWPILSTALPVAAFSWVVYVGSRSDWREKGLPTIAGVAGVLLLFFVAIWAASGAGYFWPLWPALAFGVVIAAYALVARQGLRERIGVLETTRAGAVDVQETELRRIERDLHDGAQARLVALGMNLGMAEQKLAADPDAARDLVVEARVGIEEALRELRSLARGIHPPVLTDRGLEAAISSLAHTSAVPVFVSADVPRRPPPAVETAAYFVVAEAMANAAKHAGATRIDVRIVRHPSMVEVEVADDGRGGADPAGSGLTGLRHRVEALDGTLAVTSPSGGGTTLRAELPCES